MAESVITIPTTIAEKIAGYLVAPIGRRLSYLFCYRSHMDDLNNKVQELGRVRGDLQITVDEAIRRGDEIRPIVEGWLTRADENTGEAKTFMEDEKKRTKSCFYGWCPNLKSRYQLGREADKKAQVIVEIQQHRNFPDGVSYRVPLRNVTFKNYEPFKSRASTVNQVMDALRDDEIDKIGVWGMGGVGKTTLVKQVAQLAEDEKLFTAGVYIDVSWTRDSEKLQEGIAKIQQKIADMLGLEFKGKDESTRAVELKQRLQKEKILIILDDIWKLVCLEEVGIPSKDDQKGCKIVLASRNVDLLCKDMGARVYFPLQHLPKEEAWHLFKKTAGDSVEGDELRPIAIEVVNECEGLPIAIVTIANALKGDKVYGCLKWSYNQLKGDEVKSLFLLCGWLSYGDISMHPLLQYAMGLGLFDHKSLEQARNKLVTLLRILKASSLLLDGEDHRDDFGREASRLLFMDADNRPVRMHDVVRDVARYIASKDPHRFVVREDGEELSETNGSKYISLNCKDVHELPRRLVCPELQFLLLQNISPTLNIPHTFFEGMNLLKVLDLSEMHFTTLPSTLHSLPNLRTLRLDRCKLGDIALIGELKKLQVLSMVGSDIRRLPSEMGQLTNLMLLDLNDCEQLKVIPRNILSSLSRLECLCMKSSFTQWAAEGVSDGESNACLSELNHLRHLTTIEIEVPAVELLPKEDMFFENLTRYAIFAGRLYSWERNYYETSKTLKLEQVDRSLLLRDGIGKLLKKTEELKLINLEEVCRGPIPLRSLDNLKILDVEQCHGLKFLFLLSTARGLSQLEEMKINSCNAMQQIIACEGEFEIKEVDHVGTDLQLLPKLRLLELGHLPELMNFDYFGSNLETTSQETCSQGNPDIHMPFFSYQVSFPNLEMLMFSNLPKLREIWHHQLPLGSFNNLKILEVQNCSGLLNFIPSHLIQSFNNLKELLVVNCEVLKHVFDLQGLDGNITILPMLESLCLEILPKLRSVVCNEDEDKKDSVRCLFSSSMPFHNLKFLSITNCGNKVEDEKHINTPTEDVVLFDGKVSFPPNLEELILKSLPKLMEMDVRNLPNLRILRLEQLQGCLLSKVSFPPNLEELVLKSLPKLMEMDIGNLPNLRIIRLEQLHGCLLSKVSFFPNLEELVLRSLPKLTEIDVENLSVLKILKLKELHGCLLFKVSFPPNLEELVLKSLPKLTEIDVGDLSKLRILKLKELPEYLLFKVSFPNLEKLILHDLPKLREIWHHQLPLGSFNNLKILEVQNCPGLFNLIPSHLIQRFDNLKELEVNNCKVLKHVFDLQGLDGNIRILPRLESLRLEALPKLRRVVCNEDDDKNDNVRCLFSSSTTFHNLKFLSIKDCGNKVEDEEHINTPTEDVVLFDGKVAFPALEALDISNLDNVEKIWHNEIIADSFGKLKRLSVGSCKKLQNVIPSNVLKTIPTLQNLKIVECNLLEEVFDLKSIDSKESHDIPALQLQELCLDNLKNMKYVWNEAPQGLLTYQNLKSVQVSHCPSLQIPFPGYVVRSLLQVNKVDMNSRRVKEIVAHEDIAKAVTMFIFPEVTSLTNSCPKELTLFYLGLHTLEWPMLKTLEVESCESLQMLAPKLDKPVESPIFLCDKVTFRNLEFLSLSLKLKEIQDLQVLFGALSNLKILMVENCPYLLSLFSPQFIQCINNLKKLTVKNCGLLEEVFDLNGLDHGDVERVEMLSQLEEVSLIDLPKLRYICNDIPPKVLCFQNLKSLHVEQCSSVTHLLSPSMVLGLVQLQDLRIEHCPVMKEIFTVEGKDTDNWLRYVSCFQNLKSLQVKQCDSLMYLFPYSVDLCLEQFQDLCIEHCPVMKEIFTVEGTDTDNWPRYVSCFQNLKSLQVKQCDSLMYLFPYSVALGLAQFQDLRIEHCSKMKEIIMEDGDMGNRPRQVSSLQKLKFVLVKQCDSLMYLFSHFMALGLVQLQDLCIEDCPMMTEIVTAEDRDFDNQAPLVSCFKNLTSVQGKQCDRLSHEGVTDEIIFPQITRVSLLKLPILTSFYLSRTLERIHVGGFNKVPGVLFKEEVALPNLEVLYVSGLDKVKKIWQKQLLANSFSKLKEMKVENCNELQNISTANVLNWLPSLEFLRIASCGKLQEVFDLDVTNVQEDITDNRLSKLVLDDLQNPEHICDKVLGKKLCLQNLKFLEVSKCGSMKKLFSPSTEVEREREIIRQEEGAEEVIDKIDFPELTSLSLKSLPSLTSFYPGSHTLRRVGPGDHDILITVLFNEKVAFPSLLSLHISGLDDIKEIWNNNRTANSFSRLEKVKVEYCNELQNGLPLFVLKWLSSLQFLRIANCGKLKEVFDLEGADILDDETATQLNKLELHDLPLLQYIWNRDPYGILTYENLDLVEVLRCQVLKGQFPSCLTRDLSQLEKQLIRSRWKKDLEGKKEGEDFVFPEVTYDKLLDLRKIKGKEVLKVHDYVSDISEGMPGSSG